MYDYETSRKVRLRLKAWAQETGYPMPKNHKVTKALVEAYNAANSENLEYPSDRVAPSKQKNHAKPDLWRGSSAVAVPEPADEATKRDRYLMLTGKNKRRRERNRSADSGEASGTKNFK